MKPQERKILHEEAKYLYRCIFSRDPSFDILNAYINVHRELPELKAIKIEHYRTLRVIVKYRLDALGIEFWLRQKGKYHPLRSKTILLSYLSECDATHAEFSRFIFSNTIKSIFYIHFILFKTSFSCLRGGLQKIFYGLV